MEQQTVIVGIDPSLTSTGIAIVVDGQVIYTERVQTGEMRGHERVAHILDRIDSALGRADEEADRDGGVLVGIEGTAMMAKGSSIVQIFGLWGTITHHLWKGGWPYYVVAPSARAKYATGNGTSDKKVVLAAMQQRHPELGLTSHDVADALAVAAMGARELGAPVDGEVSPSCLAALAKIDWKAGSQVAA